MLRLLHSTQLFHVVCTCWIFLMTQQQPIWTDCNSLRVFADSLSLRLLSYYPEWQHLTRQGRPLRCTHSLLEVTLSASQKSWFWFWLINGNYNISHFSVQIINQVIRLLITYGNRGDLFIWRECTEVKTNKWQIALECFPPVMHVAVLNTKPLLLVLSFSLES